MRTMARYNHLAESFLKMPADSLLQRITNPPPGDNDMNRDAHIIAYLHSAHIAFDEASSTILTGQYNRLISRWIEERKITRQQAAPYWFPDVANPDIKLSSPTFDSLVAHCTARANTLGELYFARTPFQDVDQSYWGNDELLRSFYKITPYKLKKMRSKTLPGAPYLYLEI